MFSTTNSKQADMCRFCWMCRHICPVAGATGSEGWGPRARGIMVSMIERGTEYDAEIADAMYHCTMCDACANDCVTGWRPTDFTREARMHAVVNDIAPKAIMNEIDNIMTKGNIYGAEVNETLAAEIKTLPKKAENFLYIGQTGRTFGAGTTLAVINLLKKAGVKFTACVDEPPTGAFLGDIMGFTGEVQVIATKAAETIKASDAKKVIALAPYDTVMLREKYSEWNLLDGVEIVTVTSFVADLLANGTLKANKADLTASVQEPVKLTRGIQEEKPILDLVKILGINYIPMFLNGKMSRCVSTPIMECFDRVVSKRMVEVRCDDAHRLGSSAIITCSADDTYIMSKYAYEGMEIVDLFKLLDANC